MQPPERTPALLAPTASVCREQAWTFQPAGGPCPAAQHRGAVTRCSVSTVEARVCVCVHQRRLAPLPVRACVWACTCVHTQHARVFMHVSTLPCRRARAHVGAYTHRRVCVCACVCTHPRRSVYVHLCASIQVCVNAHVCSRRGCALVTCVGKCEVNGPGRPEGDCLLLLLRGPEVHRAPAGSPLPCFAAPHSLPGDLLSSWHPPEP